MLVSQPLRQGVEGRQPAARLLQIPRRRHPRRQRPHQGGAKEEQGPVQLQGCPRERRTYGHCDQAEGEGDAWWSDALSWAERWKRPTRIRIWLTYESSSDNGANYYTSANYTSTNYYTSSNYYTSTNYYTSADEETFQSGPDAINWAVRSTARLWIHDTNSDEGADYTSADEETFQSGQDAIGAPVRSTARLWIALAAAD